MYLTMPLQHFYFSSSFLALLILFFFTVPTLTAVISPSPSPSPSPSSSPPTTPSPAPSIPSRAACKFTAYPKLCRSMLSAFRSSPSDPYEYGRFSIRECKKQARRTSQAINKLLSMTYNGRFSMSHAEKGALEDCLQLSDLSMSYLETISSELESAESLSGSLVDLVQSLLSAIVTNQQTCFDGLKASGSSIPRVLTVPFTNTTQLYSVSLGLVSHALNRGKRKRGGGGKIKGGSEHAHWVDRRTRFFETGQEFKWSSRRSSSTSTSLPGESRNLAEETGDGVVVNDSVKVAQDGSENFTTIGDAIAAAPNNTKIEDGYFLIYVMEGVYEEYNIVPKNKKNIMLLGDGINRTVITGNRSVIDGWTTYNSASFAVTGERFVAIDITFRNTAGPEKHQAVAAGPVLNYWRPRAKFKMRPYSKK